MLTISEIINSRIQLQRKPDASELRRLPYKKAFIYGRLSTPSQVRDSHESMREIARLVALSKRDGYQTELDPDEIEKLLLQMTRPMLGAVQEEGAVILDVRDLGISGQLPFEKREGLLNLKELVENGKVGAVYLTEGVSRLSCDQDKIIPYQLLKLLKEHQCRIRTPDGIWNPTIEKDWQELEGEFEDAIDECRVMAKRMFRRKKQKASRGEFVGELVLAGFIVPVLGQNKERIEAAIIWKVGFKQRVTIHRPLARGRRDAYWTQEEDGLLRMLYPSSPISVTLAALPKRSWKAIAERAPRLHVKRQRQQDHSPRIGQFHCESSRGGLSGFSGKSKIFLGALRG